jgi:hypothetical protein
VQRAGAGRPGGTGACARSRCAAARTQGAGGCTLAPAVRRVPPPPAPPPTRLPFCLSRAQVDFSVDVYSFGVIMWELYTSHPVYLGLNSLQIKQQVRGCLAAWLPGCWCPLCQALRNRCSSAALAPPPGALTVLPPPPPRAGAAGAAAARVPALGTRGVRCAGAALLGHGPLRAAERRGAGAGARGWGPGAGAAAGADHAGAAAVGQAAAYGSSAAWQLQSAAARAASPERPSAGRPLSLALPRAPAGAARADDRGRGGRAACARQAPQPRPPPAPPCAVARQQRGLGPAAAAGPAPRRWARPGRAAVADLDLPGAHPVSSGPDGRSASSGLLPAAPLATLAQPAPAALGSGVGSTQHALRTPPEPCGWHHPLHRALLHRTCKFNSKRLVCKTPRCHPLAVSRPGMLGTPRRFSVQHNTCCKASRQRTGAAHFQAGRGCTSEQPAFA